MYEFAFAAGRLVRKMRANPAPIIAYGLLACGVYIFRTPLLHLVGKLLVAAIVLGMWLWPVLGFFAFIWILGLLCASFDRANDARMRAIAREVQQEQRQY
ncbi:MAG: hypothetical protein QJR04_25185 [Burkholderia multivorans]|nr:hypothetical protein [Burkholderia multivorans]